MDKAGQPGQNDGVLTILFTDIESARVASYSFAQSTAFPALDRITVKQP